MNPLLLTFLVIIALVPFILRDGRNYRVVWIAIILLMPFFQIFVYFRYLAAFLLAVAIWYDDDRQMLLYTKEPVNRCMAIFFGFSLISAVVSSDVTLAFAPILDLVFFYLFFLVCMVVIKRQLFKSFLPTVIVFAFLTSIFIQTMQLYGFEDFYIYDPEQLNVNTGMYQDAEDRLIRYWGPFGNSLTFSSYLAVFGLFSFGYYHNSVQRKTRIFSYLLILATLYGVVLTAGRTALASIIIGLLVYSFLKNWKKAVVLLLCLVAAFIAFSVFTNELPSDESSLMYSRLLNFNEDSNSRTETWIRASPVFFNNPFFGSGPGNLYSEIGPLMNKIIVYDKEVYKLPWGHVENTYLSVLYTFGLTGFACFLYMLVKSLLYLSRALRQTTFQPVRQLANGLIIAWIVIITNMIANPVFVTDYRIIALMLLFVAFAIQVGLYSQVRSNSPIRTINSPNELAILTN